MIFLYVFELFLLSTELICIKKRKSKETLYLTGVKIRFLIFWTYKELGSCEKKETRKKMILHFNYEFFHSDDNKLYCNKNNFHKKIV